MIMDFYTLFPTTSETTSPILLFFCLYLVGLRIGRSVFFTPLGDTGISTRMTEQHSAGQLLLL